MKHLLKTKRKKPSEPPQQSIPPINSPNITAGPSGPRPELVVIPEDERDGMDPVRIAFQDRMDEDDEDSELPAPKVVASGVAIGSTARCNKPPNESAGNTEGREIESAESARITKRARRGTLLGGTNEAAEKFGPLKVALGAIPAVFANREGTIAAGNKIGVLLPRIVALEEHFNSRPSDVAEQRCRDELIRGLRNIEGQLRQLSQEEELQPPTGHAQNDEDVFRLLDDLQQTILNYQMLRRGTIDDQGFNRIDPAEATVLNNFRYAQEAEFRRGNRNGCLKGTRRTILDEIELWTHNFDKPPVYWLNGLAGTGKTTIAQTIAERTFADGRLGASFFCSRDFEDRSNLKFIFPTIAVQLARVHTTFRSIFVPLIQSDPEIAHESLYGQMNKLIVQPLVKSAISTVIVIDALDECKDDEPASAILSVLGQFVAKIPKVKFFLTGRPEPRIREGFRLPLLAEATDVFVLHDVELDIVNSDIRSFFRHHFSGLKNRPSQRNLDGWPTEEQLDLLCERAAGLFVYAMATVRCIDQKNKSPRKQLDLLLQSLESGFEGRIKFKANTTLDSLYMSILHEAFGDDSPEDDPKVRSVLGAVVLSANPLSPYTIATLLGFDVEDVFPLLSSMHSLLVLRDDINHPVRPSHKSFPDFIIDPARCANPRFRVCPQVQHIELLVGCLQLMNRRLEQNMCNLPDGVINSEVGDLRERTDQHIDKALEYACRSWHKHLVDTVAAQSPEVALILRWFLEKKFLFWLETLSVLGATPEAVDALGVAEKLLDVSPTRDLVSDYLRFLLAFFDLISTSAPHIYVSALPLSPKTSITYKLYGGYARPMARIVRGLPTSWEPIIVTVHTQNSFDAATWSPCNKFIAVVNHETVEVRDPVTLRRLNTFELPVRAPSQAVLNFSPDSRFLTYVVPGKLTSWELQTGGPIYDLPLPLIGPHLKLVRVFSPAYSLNGRVLAIAHRIWGNSYHYVSFYNLPSGMRTHVHLTHEGSIIDPGIWTHGEYLRFAAVKSGSVTIWQVGFTPTHTPVEVEQLSIPYEITAGGTLFHPALSRLAFTYRDKILVWDAEGSKLLLNSPPIINRSTVPSDPSKSFSSDTSFFASLAGRVQAYVWKESPAGYILHQKLTFVNVGIPSPLLSPNGGSIIMNTGSTIHLWHTKDQVLSRTSVPTRDSDWRDISLEFSSDATFAVFGRCGGEQALVLDLQSGDPQLVIDAGRGIIGLGLSESVIIVVDQERIITWNLPAGNRTSVAQLDIGDSVRTTIINRPPSSRKPGNASLSPDLTRIAIVRFPEPSLLPRLEICDTSTGRCLSDTEVAYMLTPRFTLDGCEVWSKDRLYGTLNGWRIMEDNGFGITQLETLGLTVLPQERLQWHSSCGYEVTPDGWVLSPTRKRLLWLPHHWRSGEEDRKWRGRFLGLVHSKLPTEVILEFFE